MSKLEYLFKPITVGRIGLKNRLVMLAIATGYVEDGRPTKRLQQFLAERARGGTGLIITTINTSFPQTYHLAPSICEDAFIPDLRKLVEAVHAHGVPVVAELLRMRRIAENKEGVPEEVAPSSIAVRPNTPAPRALSIDEIHVMIEEYGQGARRAREAGFDGVEILAGVGNLLSRFISPLTNVREDEYGGSLENRMRFLLESIGSIRKNAGDDYTVGVRYSAHEFLGGGYDLEGGKEIGRILEKAGVDWLDLQVGLHESPVPTVHRETPLGNWSYLAGEIKGAVSVPVVSGYQLGDPFIAERALAEGKGDLVGLARALIADPEFANKAKEGRFDEINRCIRCLRCMDQIVAREVPLDMCSVNPRIGKELDTAIEPASKPKKVFIIGGGPAGMEAARVAASRGHQVTLWESKDELGGLIRYATIAPYKADVGNVKDYLVRQIEKLGVNVKLGEEATPESIIAGKPEAVIVATGSSPVVPDVPGVEKLNVSIALDVLAGDKEVGEDVLIIGGGVTGCEVAEFLAAKGKKVTILEMLKRVGSDIGPTDRFAVMMRLKKANIRMETDIKATGITDKGVKVVRNGVEQFFEGDSVVLAAGAKPDRELALQLEGKVPALHSIGDCAEVHMIGEAIKAGYELAREL